MSSEKRRFCIEIGADLLNQIERRAKVHHRSKNMEITHLLDFAIASLGGSDPIVEMADHVVKRTSLYLEVNLLDTIKTLSEKHYRPQGREMARLLRYALDEKVRMDLNVIEQMVREDQSGRALQQTGTV